MVYGLDVFQSMIQSLKWVYLLLLQIVKKVQIIAARCASSWLLENKQFFQTIEIDLEALSICLLSIFNWPSFKYANSAPFAMWGSKSFIDLVFGRHGFISVCYFSKSSRYGDEVRMKVLCLFILLCRGVAVDTWHQVIACSYLCSYEINTANWHFLQHTADRSPSVV